MKQGILSAINRFKFVENISIVSDSDVTPFTHDSTAKFGSLYWKINFPILLMSIRDPISRLWDRWHPMKMSFKLKVMSGTWRPKVNFECMIHGGVDWLCKMYEYQCFRSHICKLKTEQIRIYIRMIFIFFSNQLNALQFGLLK